MSAAEAQALAAPVRRTVRVRRLPPGLRDLRPAARAADRARARVRLRDPLRAATVMRGVAPARAVRRRGARLPAAAMLRDPAQRRGPDAPGGGADRRRPGALPRLLVVLPARPAGAAGRAVGGLRARRCWRGRSCARSRPERSRCWRGGSRAAAARRAGRRSPPGWRRRFALAYPSGPHPFPITLALCLGALLCLERPVLAGVLTGRRRRSGGSSSPPIWRSACCSRTRCAGQSGRAAARYAGAARRHRCAAVRAVRDRRGTRRRVRAADPLPAARLRRLPVAAVPARPTTARSTPARRGGFLSDSAESLLLFYLPLALVLGLRGRAGGRRAAVHARGMVAGGGRGVRARDAALPAGARRPVPHRSAGGHGRGARRLGGAGAAAGRWAAIAAVVAAALACAGARLRGRRGRRPRLARCARAGGTPPRSAGRRRRRGCRRARRARSRRRCARSRTASRPASRSTSCRGAATSSRRAIRCSTCSRTARTRRATTSRRPAWSPRSRSSARSSPTSSAPARGSWCATPRRSPPRASPTPPGARSGVTLLDDYVASDLPRGRAPRRAGGARAPLARARKSPTDSTIQSSISARQARPAADPERRLGDPVGVRQLTGDAVLAALEAGLADEVARQQQPRVDPALEQELLQPPAAVGAALAQREREAEPRRVRARAALRGSTSRSSSGANAVGEVGGVLAPAAPKLLELARAGTCPARPACR